MPDRSVSDPMFNDVKCASVCVTDRNSRIVKGMGGILHNMLYRVAAARQPIRDEDAVNTFQRFRECKDSMIACKALILQVQPTPRSRGS